MSSNNKNPPVMKPSRRSGRRRGQEHDPVVAPGFGTKKDIEKLSQELSVGSEATLPAAAVEAMMNSRGRGVLSPGKDPSAPNSNPGATSSAWADFMKEEGVAAYGAGGGGGGTAEAAASSSSQAEEAEKKKRKAGAAKKKGGGKRKAYNLEALVKTLEEPATKKAKLDSSEGGGALLQTGTLDVTVVGRKGLSKEAPSYQLMVPTQILPGVGITKVFTGCNAVHSIALDVSGKVYGWGRNDSNQLGSLPSNVAVPTPLDGLEDYNIISAAMGKFHTLFLTDEGKVLAVGSNKVGQCGIKSSTEMVSSIKQCIFPPDVKIVQIACGEQLSVALSDQGQLYTTGSSEFGQLGNGETGEYFVTANKLAFTNCNVFTLRTRFMEADPAQEMGGKDKLLPIQEDIRFQAIACGKHHTIAVEASYENEDDDDEPPRPRVFSWGCGNYGVLGHGIQADEYFPREISCLQTTVWLPPGPLSVSCGAQCCLLKTSNGHVYYWGKHRSVGEATMKPMLVEALANNRHVVSHCAAGGQTVVCCTENAQSVSWGQGPHGELGFGAKKSSAKPDFVEALTGCRIQDVACGYGHTCYVVKDDDAEDKAAIKKLALLDASAKDELEAIFADSAAIAAATTTKKAGKKKKN